MPLQAINPIEISEYFGLNTKQSRAKLALGFSSDLHDIDLSSPGIAKTRAGSDTLNDYEAPFGNGSLELDGTGDYLSVPDNTDFDFSGGVWTVNVTFNLDTLSANQTLWSQITDASNYIQCRILSTGAIELKVVSGGSTVVQIVTATGLVVSGTTYQLEVVENGNNYYIFLEGTQVGTVSDTDRPANYTGAFNIGRINLGGSEEYVDGHLDEFRILKAEAAHTASFTKYTTAFSDSATTTLLLHFEGTDQSTTITDSSTNGAGSPHTVTANGNAKLHVGLMSFTPRRLHDYLKPSTNVHTLIGNGGTIVFTMALTGRWQQIASGFTSDKVMDFLNYLDNVYFSNGTDEGKVYTGSLVRKWGIAKPTTAPTAATGAAGALTGAYQYAVSYYNSTSQHESTRSPISNTVNPSSQRVGLSSIPVSADTQVDKKRLYRTTAGGGIFLFLTEINNADTTYTDNAADSTLGSREAPEDNDPPPSFVGIEEWDGRIWGFELNSTTVKFSNDEFLTPAGSGLPHESFSPDNVIDFKATVYAIKKAPTFNELWVHTSLGVIAVKPTGVPEDPYFPTVRNSSWFSIAHFSVQNIYNDQWFLAENGKIISLDSAGSVNYESYFIEPTLSAGNKVRFPANQSTHYRFQTKNQYRIIYPESGQTEPNIMLAANYLNRTPPDENGISYPAWELHNIAASCIATFTDSNEDDILLTGHTNGAIKKQDIGTSDDDTAIDWSFSVGWMRSSVTPDKTLFPRWVKQYFNPLGDYSFTLRTDFDFGSAGGQTYSVKAAPIGDRLDIDFVLDTSKLAGVDPLKPVTTDLGGDYTYVELTYLGNVINETMELHNITIMPHQIEGFRR